MRIQFGYRACIPVQRRKTITEKQQLIKKKPEALRGGILTNSSIPCSIRGNIAVRQSTKTAPSGARSTMPRGGTRARKA